MELLSAPPLDPVDELNALTKEANYLARLRQDASSCRNSKDAEFYERLRNEILSHLKALNSAG